MMLQTTCRQIDSRPNPRPGHESFALLIRVAATVTCASSRASATAAGGAAVAAAHLHSCRGPFAPPRAAKHGFLLAADRLRPG